MVINWSERYKRLFSAEWFLYYSINYNDYQISHNYLSVISSPDSKAHR